jgi:hypothetical protein
MREYISDMWNVVDFITNSLYVATIALRITAYYDVSLIILSFRFCFKATVSRYGYFFEGLSLYAMMVSKVF